MSDPPRRLPPGSEARKQAALHSTGVQTGRGLFPSARPVNTQPQAQPFIPPAPSGAAVIAGAQYRDTGIAWPSPARFTPDIEIGFDTYADHLSTSSHDVNCLTPGWYQASAKASVSGATAGELIRMVIAHTNFDDAASSFEYVSAAGDADLFANSLPFPVTQYDIDNFFNGIELSLFSYSGTGTISNVKLCVVCYAGAAPVQTF